jgi:ATP-dependent Clp protease ATP-binding subunit ClpC
VELRIQVGGGRGPGLSQLAQREASAGPSDRLETQHILLALLRRPSPAARALSSCGVTHELVQGAVRKVIAAGASEERHDIDSPRAASCERLGVVPPSLQAERAFRGAIGEAQRLGHNVAHWGHALLGLLREDEGIAVAALQALGVDLNSLREAVLREMSQVNERGVQGRPEDPGRDRS